MKLEPILIGDWRLDPATNSLVSDNQTKQLEARMVDVLAYLARHAPRTVPGDELLDQFWRGRIVEHSTVHRTISKIRRALGDDPGAPRYIETVPKRGYRIIAPVETESRPDVDPAQRTADSGKTTVYHAVAGANALLVEETDLLKLGAIRLRRGQSSVGRGPDNDLVFAHDSVSKRHARFYLDNSWVIEDLGSTNGVRVNDAYVEKTTLENGDRIQLGRVVFRFELS